MSAPPIPPLTTTLRGARGSYPGRPPRRGRAPRGDPSGTNRIGLGNLGTDRRDKAGGGRRPEEEEEDEEKEKEKEKWKEQEWEKKADKVVQRTDEDASVSRLSAVEVGYLHDPFAELFVNSSMAGAGAGARGVRGRRFPIINRGTYIRTRAIDQLVTLFLSALPSVKKQIISLGAGSDTRFFRLASQFPASSFVYHELDFPALTGPKISTITRSPLLIVLVPTPIALSPTSLHSPSYHIHPIDLRTLDPSSPSHHGQPRPDPTTQLPHIESSVPTLIISECCLVYLAPHTADAVAAYLTHTLFPPSTPLGMILYEPIRPHDAFGQVMVANLAARGIALQTLRQYGSLAAQRERMLKYGFGGGNAITTNQGKEQEEDEKIPGAAAAAAAVATGGIGVADVNHLWEKGVPAEEKARVAGLEMVDELEEWELLAAHYCVVWAWRDGVPAAAAGIEGNRAGAGAGGGGDEDTTRGAKGTGTGTGTKEGVWEGWTTVAGQEP